MKTFFGLLFLLWLIISLCDSNKKKSNKNYNRSKNIKEKYDDAIDFDVTSKRLNNNRIKTEKIEENKIQEGLSFKNKQIVTKVKSSVENSFFEFNVNCLWHLTHRDNLDNILEKGILSHSESHKLGLNSIDISDPGAQQWRERVDNPYKKKIHEFVPFYITPLNPMLYVRRNLQNELCLLEISLLALEGNQYLITDGNAASRGTLFFDSVDSLKNLPWDVLRAKYWNNFPDGRRKRCAEVLIYPKVSVNMVRHIHCYSRETFDRISGKGVDVQLSRKYFF